MGCCISKVRCFKKKPKVNLKKLNLLMLGLDGAGKTTLVKKISNEDAENVLPTTGFLPYHLQEYDCNISLYDVGGGPRFRNIWKQYYADVHGMIFVVDSEDVARINECRIVLTAVLKDSRMAGKPVLLLANKQDLPGALDEIDIVEKLQLERLVNQQKCPTLVELCSAINLDTKKSEIQNGFRWLIRNICKDYPALNNRVLVDMASQEEAEEVAMAARRRKLEILRRKRAHEEWEDDVEEIDDPFKPISQLVTKPHQNGRIPSPKGMEILPAVVDGIDEAEDDEDVIFTVRKGKPAHSQSFFSSQDWSSTTELLDGLTEKKFGDFVKRPKSSGAIEFNNNKRKKKKRRRFRTKNNRTAPQPLAEFTATKQRPIPAIFDPAFQTEVTILNGPSRNGPSSVSQVSDELVLNVPELSRKI